FSKDPDRVRGVTAKDVDVFLRGTPDEIRHGAEPQTDDAERAPSSSGVLELIAEIFGHLPAEITAELRREDSKQCAKERVVARAVTFHRPRAEEGRRRLAR